jgi:hypothetical protein
MSAAPDIGRIAIIKIGATAVGYAKGFDAGIDGTIVKEYTLDSGGNPSVLKLGNLSYPVSIEKLFVDKTYADYVLAKNPVTIEVAPQGTPVGKPKFTYSGVILNKWGLTNIKPDGIIGERVSGEGTGMTTGTY